MNDFYTNTYNPDVLSCLANLSNDEVFTPPDIANKMLDMLPQELFCDSKTTFLDPASKSGVFLREIAKRLLVGLEDEIPDLQERVDHIFQKQLFGLAITEMTSLLSRRSVYCSKYPNSIYSVSKFDDPEGNIRFKKIKHVWRGEKCVFCGASKGEYDRDEALETHAYEFIHTTKPEEIFNMKFDVIIGNPPYQLEVGVQKDNYSIPLYHKFVQQAKKLKPRFISMIIPARWYAGGRGLDSFRNEMLNDKSIRVLVDYFDPNECFPGIDLSGGVCYFLWDRDNKGNCDVKQVLVGKSSTINRPLLEDGEETFIRFNDALSVYSKIKAKKENSFSTLVSPQTPFGLVSSFSEYKETPFPNAIKLHTVKGIKYIEKKQIKKNPEWIDGNKVYISKSYGERGSFPYLFLAKPFIGDVNSCCTQTYLMIGPTKNKEESENIRTYIKTKFFRFLIMLKKNTQDAMRGVYAFVPIQDFSETWTDEKLYAKYGLTEEEIAFIESMVRPMDLNDGGEDE